MGEPDILVFLYLYFALCCQCSDKTNGDFLCVLTFLFPHLNLLKAHNACYLVNRFISSSSRVLGWVHLKLLGSVSFQKPPPRVKLTAVLFSTSLVASFLPGSGGLSGSCRSCGSHVGSSSRGNRSWQVWKSCPGRCHSLRCMAARRQPESLAPSGREKIHS